MKKLMVFRIFAECWGDMLLHSCYIYISTTKVKSFNAFFIASIIMASLATGASCKSANTNQFISSGRRYRR